MLYIMQHIIQKRLLCVFVLTLTILLCGWNLVPTFADNHSRVIGLKKISECLHSELHTRDIDILSYAIWSGKNNLVDCSEVVPQNSLEDILVIDSWLQGKIASPMLIDRISPVERQKLFSLRNTRWIPPDTTNSYSNEDILFTLTIVSWLRLRDMPEQSASLAQWILKQKPNAYVANNIITIFGNPRKVDEISLFNELHQSVAQLLPDYAYNYASWFEFALPHGDWSSAEESCQQLKNYVQPPYEGLAASCDARLAFYREDYEASYILLENQVNSFPQNPVVLYWFGISAKQLGHYKEAEQVFERVIENRHHPSWTVYNQLDDKQPDWRVYVQLAECQKISGNIIQSQTSYQKALEYPMRTEYRIWIKESIKQ